MFYEVVSFHGDFAMSLLKLLQCGGAPVVINHCKKWDNGIYYADKVKNIPVGMFSTLYKYESYFLVVNETPLKSVFLYIEK